MVQRKIYLTPSLPTGLHIKWSGNFSMETLYIRMKYWLDFNGFGADENFEEQEYMETVKGDSKQIQIRWHAEKPVSDYFSYVIDIQFFIPSLKQVEVQKDGKSVKMNSGTFEIRMHAYLLLDAQNRWENKTIQGIYEKFIVKSRIDTHKGEVYDKIYSLRDEIIRFLELEGFK